MEQWESEIGGKWDLKRRKKESIKICWNSLRWYCKVSNNLLIYQFFCAICVCSPSSDFFTQRYLTLNDSHLLLRVSRTLFNPPSEKISYLFFPNNFQFHRCVLSELFQKSPTFYYSSLRPPPGEWGEQLSFNRMKSKDSFSSLDYLCSEAKSSSFR